MSTGLGQRIKQRRLELDLSQEELAARMGLKSKSTICKIERGEDNLTTDTVRKYADALHTTPSYLMGWEEAPASPDPAKVEEAMKLYEQFSRLTPEYQKTLLNMLEVGRIAADLHLTERDKKQ